MKEIKIEIECDSCSGTGLYSGMCEGSGVAVVCSKCDGSGKYMYNFKYNIFTGRKKKENIERVYVRSQYKLGLGIVNFKGVGEVDMNKQGVSYQEFCDGKMPDHIKEIECPMQADQGACHKIKGFTDECNRLNGEWIYAMSDCKVQCNKKACWKRFDQ